MVAASCESVPGEVDELLLVADETELTLTGVSIGRFAAALDAPLVPDVELDVELEGVTPPAKIPFVPVRTVPEFPAVLAVPGVLAVLPELEMPAAAPAVVALFAVVALPPVADDPVVAPVPDVPVADDVDE